MSHDAMFVSRGDNSGTHHAEQKLWEASGVTLSVRERKAGGATLREVGPRYGGYRSVGQGMGNTLLYATEVRGYTLSDRGTYYAFALGEKLRTNLKILCEGDARLRNVYSVIAVNAERLPGVNGEGTEQYIAWLTSPATQARIASYRVGGKVLFHPFAEVPDAR